MKTRNAIIAVIGVTLIGIAAAAWAADVAQFNGTYRINADTSRLTIKIGGATYNKSLNEIKAGATAGDKELPPDVGKAIEEALPSQIIVTVSPQGKLNRRAMTIKDANTGNQIQGHLNLKKHSFIFRDTKPLKTGPQKRCGSVSGNTIKGNFRAGGGGTKIEGGKISLNTLAGCPPAMFKISVTLHFTGEKIN